MITSVHYSQYHFPPLWSEKQRDGDLIQFQIRFVCVCSSVFVGSTCLLGVLCSCVLCRGRALGTSFTRSSDVRKPLSVHQNDRREALAMDGAPCLKKINKNGTIVIEALSRISAGV